MHTKSEKISTNFSFGSICRFSAIFIVFCAASLSSTYANNIPQPESNSNSQNLHAVELKNALSRSNLPLINVVTKLYEAREHNLIWSDGEKYNSKAHDLLNLIQNARKAGLNPADYDLEVIQYFLETTAADSNTISKSDITFTHAYVRIASHIDSKNSLKLTDEFNLL